MKHFFGQIVRVVVLSGLAAATFGVVLAWSGPSAAAPNSNASAPINTSSTAQTKAGSITATGFCLSSPSVCFGSGSGALTGGAYQWSTVAGCYIGNWITGGCSCPSYAPYARWVFYMDTNSTYGGGRGYLCSNV